MLIKPFETEFVEGNPGRAAQTAHQVCSPYFTPPPPRCTTILIYGPPSPVDHQPTVVGSYTVCP